MSSCDTLRSRVERELGWKPGESHSFGMAALAEFVRVPNPALRDEIREMIRRGDYIAHGRP
jgi:hypothetical protein